MTPELHPWLYTSEATEAARNAIRIPMATLGTLASQVGADGLESEALIILTECALPPRDRTDRFDESGICAADGCSNPLVNPKRGKPAKFCSPNCRKRHSMRAMRTRNGTAVRKMAVATPELHVPHAHIGSMWSWPEDKRVQYAVRIVGTVLNNWLRTQHRWCEMPASDTLANTDIPVPVDDDLTPVEFLTEFLESHGVMVTGDESFEELAEAALFIQDAPNWLARDIALEYVHNLGSAA